MDLDSKEPEVDKVTISIVLCSYFSGLLTINSGMEVESVAGSSRLLPSTPVKAIIHALSYPTPESIPRVARLVSRWMPFRLLPSFARRSMDVDIPKSPTQYCDVATATSPIAVEEDVDYSFSACYRGFIIALCPFSSIRVVQ